MTLTRWPAALGALFALVLPAAALAQPDFPARSLRLIAPVPPGSPPDVVARLVAEPLAKALGQAVLVENRPGANQTLGLAAVAGAQPDGHVLGLVSLPTAVVPSLVARMPYDTLRDLAPVREVAWTSNVLVVRGESETRSIAELVAMARSRGGKVSFASGGNGTPAHVMAELLRQQAGFDATHVPFKGAPEGVNAVIAGHVDFMLASAGAVAPHARAGRLRALAQTTGARLAAVASVPTFSELGFDGMTVRDWQGLVATGGTPESTLRRIADALRDVLQRSEVAERLRALAMEPVEHSDPAHFRAFLAAEVKRWATVAAAAKIEAQ